MQGSRCITGSQRVVEVFAKTQPRPLNLGRKSSAPDWIVLLLVGFPQDGVPQICVARRKELQNHFVRSSSSVGAPPRRDSNVQTPATHERAIGEFAVRSWQSSPAGRTIPSSAGRTLDLCGVARHMWHSIEKTRGRRG